MNVTEQKAAGVAGVSSFGGVLSWAAEMSPVITLVGTAVGVASFIATVIIHQRNHKLKSRELDLKERELDIHSSKSS